METFLSNTVAAQRITTPTESTNSHPPEIMSHKSPAQVSETVPRIRANFSNTTQTEAEPVIQPMLGMSEGFGDPMNFTPPSASNNDYAEFQVIENLPALPSPSIIHKMAENVSVAGSLMNYGSERKLSINLPSNVRVISVLLLLSSTLDLLT